MKDFALDKSGDILINERGIDIVSGKEQEAQKIRQVLGTKIGEWEYNANEGIDFNAIFQKPIDTQRIRETIQSALYEINADYVLQECSYNAEKRTLNISVTANNQESMDVYILIGEA